MFGKEDFCFQNPSESSKYPSLYHNEVCYKGTELYTILMDFWPTVKAATLIYKSGPGSAISSANEGKSVSFIIWQRFNKLFGPHA